MNCRGFTLVESLIAMTILGVALAALVPSFLNYMDVNTISEERSDAVAAAQLVMERLRQRDPAALPDTGSSSPELISIGSRDYEVVTFYCLASEYCGTTSRHLFLEVNFGGQTVYTVESVYTRLR